MEPGASTGKSGASAKAEPPGAPISFDATERVARKPATTPPTPSGSPASAPVPAPAVAPAPSPPAAAERPVLAVTAGPSPVLVKEVGGFELLSRLGEGGMGQVFKARQRSLDRIVALKVLTPRLAENPEYVKRFEHEARLAARLNHPSIVQVIEQGQDGLVRFIAFEFVDGPSLEAVLKDRRQLPEPEALAIARDMADALAYGAEHGLVHRDVKPENILLTAKGVPKLADLGLAKMQGEASTKTQTGVVMGTPHYMAPEHALAEKDVDSRADLYSLGVVLYRCVTGTYPWLAPTPLHILSRNINEDIPDPRTVAHDVSPAVATLIRGLTLRDRALRYPSPSAALRDIELMLEGKAPLGPEPYLVEAAKGPAPGPGAAKVSSRRRPTSSQAIPVAQVAATPSPSPAAQPPAPPSSGRRVILVPAAPRRGRSLAIALLGVALGGAASFGYVAMSEHEPPVPPTARTSPSPAALSPSPAATSSPAVSPSPTAAPRTAPSPRATPSPAPRPTPRSSPPSPASWEKLPIEKWPANARVWDGHRWRATPKGHVHGPGCGHSSHDGRWNVYPVDPREVDYYLTYDQKLDPSSGIYEYQGKTYYLPGHVHDNGCGHVLVNDRWTLPD